MENNTILHIIQDGKDLDIEVLHYFTLDYNGKDYIIYKIANNRKNNLIYSAEIRETNAEIILKEIKDEQVIIKLQQVMQELYN